jgi:CHAT domain-containing protein
MDLIAMEALVGGGNTKLFLAEEATEAKLKGADLASSSILFLATHGLVAGEVGDIGEPGLVFTPPAAASLADDGLLTASEVAALRIGAGWVILSACNTAAGDGRAGAPGLSGLARAFFFAGSESLLASHWPVRDDVAAVLTVRLFEILRADPKLSRAEALQQVEREIRNDTRDDPYLKSWSHPSAWAPFSLIGDVGD